MKIQQFPGSAWQRGLIAACAWLFSISWAHAVEQVCVQNEVQLNEALNVVQSIPQIIKIHQGTYRLDNSVLVHGANYYMLGGTRLQGGYTDNCASREIDARKTSLTTASGFSPTLNLVGSITFDNLTLSFDRGLSVFAIDFITEIEPGAAFVLSRSRITASGHTGLYGPLLVRWSEDADLYGEIDIVDSLIVGNNSDPAYCAVTFLVNKGQPTVNVVNSTFMDNSGGGGLCMYNSQNGDEGAGVLLSHDNIFWNNPTVDLSADTPNLELVDNTIGLADIPTPSFGEIGRLSANPNLDGDYRPIEAPKASVINTGEYDNGTFTATDFLGHPRVVSSRVDRGAFESSINDSPGQIVTNTNDSGIGSLRTAIESLNAGSGGTIGFNIGTGCGPHVIHLLTPLPTIAKPTVIFGYSQPGAQENDLDVGYDATQCIVLDGSAGIGDGLSVADGAGTDTQLVVIGLAFGGFSHAAISFYGGKGHGVSGNRIGGSVGGVDLAPSGSGIIVGPGIGSVDIGGSDAASRNLILEATTDGISLDGPSNDRNGSHDANVDNNYIGVGWNPGGDNYVNRGNGVKGIRIGGNHHTVRNNLIGYNGNDGIDITGADAANNAISGNAIGTGDDGTDLGNGSMGVRVENGGHDNSIRANQIAHNAGTGVRIVNGRGNTIRKNALTQNGGLGIDLADGGVATNDNDTTVLPIDFANRGLDYPLLTAAAGSAHNGVIGGTFRSTAGTYSIDLYSNTNCDASAHGEGGRWLGSTSVTIPQPPATKTFTLNFSLVAPAIINTGSSITATATDSVGNTSEFSTCFAYQSDLIFKNGFDP